MRASVRSVIRARSVVREPSTRPGVGPRPRFLGQGGPPPAWLHTRPSPPACGASGPPAPPAGCFGTRARGVVERVGSGVNRAPGRRPVRPCRSPTAADGAASCQKAPPPPPPPLTACFWRGRAPRWPSAASCPTVASRLAKTARRLHHFLFPVELSPELRASCRRPCAGEDPKDRAPTGTSVCPPRCGAIYRPTAP